MVVKKTSDFPFYHGITTIPNNIEPDQFDFYLGVALRSEEKVNTKPRGPGDSQGGNNEGPGNQGGNKEGPGNQGGNKEGPGNQGGEPTQLDSDIQT